MIRRLAFGLLVRFAHPAQPLRSGLGYPAIWDSGATEDFGADGVSRSGVLLCSTAWAGRPCYGLGCGKRRVMLYFEEVVLPAVDSEKMTPEEWQAAQAVVPLYGLKQEDLEKPSETVVSGGVTRAWQTVMAVDAAGLVKDGNEKKPLWQNLTGLYPEIERTLQPNDRARRIGYLLRVAEKIVRHELKADEVRGKQRAESFAEERSYKWDPLRTVCFYLRISQYKLSGYSKELNGMSAPEIVDRIRAESVRSRMKRELKGFVAEFFQHEDEQKGRTGEGAKGGNGEGTAEQMELAGRMPAVRERAGGTPAVQDAADAIWMALKLSRRLPRWHRTTWAAGHGFSSYTRFFRACLLCYGKTPHEVEMEVIEEILTESEKLEVCQNERQEQTAAVRECAAGEPEVVRRE